jgi:hypothetical protein
VHEPERRPRLAPCRSAWGYTEPRLGNRRFVTIYESNPEVRSTGAEIAEFVDAPVQNVSSSTTPEQNTSAVGLAHRENVPGSNAPPSPAVADCAIRYLRIYLNDHRAGATGGISLARRCQRNNEGSALGEEMRSIVEEFGADAASLSRISSGLGIRENRFKQSAAKTAEWLGRFKLNGEIRTYSPLSRLLEVELLLSAIDAKRSLWKALMSSDVPVPIGIDLRELDDRASRQRARLRPHHIRAAHAALASAGMQGAGS